MKYVLILGLAFLNVFTFGQTSAKKLKVGDEMVTESGIKIRMVSPGKGKPIEKGDKIRVHYTGTLLDDRKFDSSRDRDQPFEFVVGMKQVIQGWDDSFVLLRGGDRAILTIPAELGYGDTPMPKIPAGSWLVFDVEVLEVIQDFAPKQFSTKGFETLTSQSGLTYTIIEQGSGARAEKGKTVEVHYTGYLENGDIFDSSVLRGQPISFRLGAGMVIPGWDEGIAYLNAGGRALLSIPYELAYGESGRPPTIPPKARLIFNVELVSVK
jgi:peptidylprolyl isomerase